jgi:hypothetical protein
MKGNGIKLILDNKGDFLPDNRKDRCLDIG